MVQTFPGGVPPRHGRRQ